MDNKNKSNNEIGEDATQYGEFISSYFSWITPKQQRETVDKLENITKKDKK